MFARFSRAVEQAVGSPWAFTVAGVAVVVWALTGPLFGWSETWQLVINTGTTIITFLMVFLIQSSQSRDTAAIQLKLDELVRAVGPARNEVIAAEERNDDEFKHLKRNIQWPS